MRAAIAVGEPVNDDGCDMPSVNDDYPYTDAFDHFVSRASVTAADGRRAAFAALMWMSSGTGFRVEIQHDNGDDSVATLEVMRADVVQPERPSGQKMVDDLVAWARERLSVQADER